MSGDGWEETTIGDICDKVEYGTSSKSKPVGNVPVLRMGNIQEREIDWADLVYTDDEDEIEKYALSKNDVLFNRTNSAAHVGKTCIYRGERPAIFAGYLIRLHYQRDRVDGHFLNYYLNSDRAREYGKTVMSRSVNQANINGTKLKAYRFPLPPLAEQKRIVSILDEAFSAIAKAKENAEKNLANARELFESYLNRVFTQLWEDCELVTMSDIATDITDGDHNAPPKSETGLPFITISNINKSTRKVDFSNTFKVPREYFDGLKPNRKPRRNDVLYTVTGSFGIPVLVDHDTEFCFQRHIGLIRPKEDVDSTWLYYLCLTPQVFTQAESRATGTAQKTVSLKVLRSIEVPKVGLPEQQEMLPALEQVATEAKRLETIYTQKLANLDELKQSLLQKAFTGQLTHCETIAV